MLIYFIVVIGGLVLLVFLVNSSNDRSYQRSVNYASSVATAHHVTDVVTDGSWTVGIDPGTRTLVVVGSKGTGHRFSYDHVASVELTPIYSSHSSGTSTTTSNRGSQFVGAGIGAAIAGPAGLVVGGLSGSKTTTHDSISTSELQRIELKIRLYFDTLPVVKIGIPRPAFEKTERLAARLANAVDQRDHVPKGIAVPQSVETPLLTYEQTQGQPGSAQQDGWWVRTFG